MSKKYRPRNQVQVFTDNGNNLSHQIPLFYSQKYYNKNQKYISFGGKDSTENRVLVDQARNQLQLDLETGQFNPSNLLKYQHPNKQARQNYIPNLPISFPLLKEIFDKYCDYKKGQLAESTYLSMYKCTYLNAIKIAPQNLEQQLEIRNFIVENYKPSGVIRLLGVIHAAIIWAQKEKLIDSNYESNFKTYQDDYRHSLKRKNIKRVKPKLFEKYHHQPDKIAWNQEEMEIIIEAVHQRRNVKYKKLDYIAYFIEFLFRTGVRHGEGVALTWRDVSEDFSFITVNKSYSTVLKKNKGTKTGKNRTVPCSLRVTEILKLLKVNSSSLDEPIFKNSQGNPIQRKYLRTIWAGGGNGSKSIIEKLIEEGKLPQYLDMYSTRRTFISNQIRKYDVKTVADWVGDNPETILKHYCYRDEKAVPID